jgi:hypothetical protein
LLQAILYLVLFFRRFLEVQGKGALQLQILEVGLVLA